jgi:hypothetical protein
LIDKVKIQEGTNTVVSMNLLILLTLTPISRSTLYRRVKGIRPFRNYLEDGIFARSLSVVVLGVVSAVLASAQVTVTEYAPSKALAIQFQAL